MNATSLQYNNTKNQQPLWMDDPFDLKGFYKDEGNMNIKKHSKAFKTLEEYAEDLVSLYANYDGDEYHLSLLDVPYAVRGELASKYIESIDGEIDSEIFADKDCMASLLSVLKDGGKRSKEKLSTDIRNSVIKYYAGELQDILFRACETYLDKEMESNGMSYRVDEEHGDSYWN